MLIFITVIISIPTVLFFVINSQWTQNRAAQAVAAMLSGELDNRVSIGDIRISWFNKLTVHDLLVTDVHGDTILAAPELIGRLNLLAFSKQKIDIRKAVLHRADIRLAIDPETDDINIMFIIEKLESKDTLVANQPKWTFDIRTVELNDCRFSFKDVMVPFDRPFGIDYADIEVEDLNLTVSDFRPGDSLGGVAFRIRRLSCVEKSGLDLRFMSADFAVNSNNLSFKNMHIVTSLSELQAKDASFHFDSFQDFGGDNFISKVRISMDIQSSDIAFADLSHFIPYFKTYSNKVVVTGRVTGTVENLRGEKVAVRFGEMTRINGNFDLKGLPAIRSTWIYADITDLLTSPEDIERIHVASSHTGHVNLPITMHQFTALSYNGNFTGFFDDFVTYGTFTTNLGSLLADVSIKPMAGLNNDTTFTFRGTLKTEQFHLGKLLTQPSIGAMTMSGVVEGSASGRGNIHAQVEGRIENIDLRDYPYRNISVNGAVNNRMYDGQMSINEPNLKMDFSGKVDMTNVIPAYDFWANVEHARLHRLKLIKNDTSSFAAFTIRAAFSGTNIDNLAGEFELKNSLFRRNSREIEINDLELFTKDIRDTSRFILLSDILDAEIWGRYQFLKLPESFFSLVKNFSPAWVPSSVSPDSLSNNNFRFQAKFKDTQKLTDFFVNEFRVAPNTRIEGVYDPAQLDMHFVMEVPYMRLGKQQWRGLYANGSVEDSTFVLEAGCAGFRVNTNLSLENLTVLSRVRGDSAGLDIRWNNWDSILYKGSLNSKVFFRKKPKKQIPMIRILSSPGQFVTANDVWTFAHRGVFIDSTSVRLDRLRASRDSQQIQISGIISQREQDKLEIAVKDFDLSVLNSSLQFDKLVFGGIANGSASLSNLYEVPVFVSDIRVDNFALNGSQFGTTNLAASWNSYNRSVRIEAESILNDLRTMLVKGNYFITTNALNFDVFLEKVPVRIMQPYVESMFTDLEGTLSGEMNLTGTIDKPLLNGAIELRRAALTLDYTKTRYSFSGKASVRDNTISFNGLELFDRFSNPCKITEGIISTADFKDIAFDLRFVANNLEVLNTTERDNNLFYGKAFATGGIHIKGNPQDIRLDINARTEKNTQFNIPLSASDELTKTSFITFVDHTPRQRRPLELLRRRRNVTLLPDEPDVEPKFAVNINMDVTPDAEAQLIFDARIGDIMRARGSGNLRLNIASNRFDMTGTYTIEEGDYLFTLRNVFNKKFVIEKGGIITWNGDPSGALLNLKAVYATKPSLYDLIGDENSKRSVPVECILHITNKLTDPNIRFELAMPNAEQEVRSFLNAATNSEEEMTQQFLALLALNRFYPDPNNQSNRSGTATTGLETMGLATASEFLTSQLSYMISQWSTNFDVDLSYNPGTYETGQNVAVDLNTNLWNLHVDYNMASENSENAVGDVTFDTKLSQSGKLRFKIFKRTNAIYLSQNQNIQGVGFLYRQDFNRLRDLFTRKKSPAERREDETPEPQPETPPKNDEKPATATSR